MNAHSKKTKYFEAPFLVLQLVVNSGLLEVPLSTLKDYNRNTGPRWTTQDLEGPQPGPHILTTAPPDTEWSFQVLTGVSYL